jgi:hypothetical protein
VKRLIQPLALAILVLGLTAASTSADMVINLGNDLTLAPGGIGSIDISISYTGSLASMDNTLADFGLELQITPVGSPTSILQFVTSPDPYSNPNYVFAGQSFGSDNGIPFWSAPFTSTNPNATPNDSILGGDSDDKAPGYVTIPPTSGGTNSLLATVDFQAAPGATPGDSFQISLVNNSNTYFDGQTPGLPYTVTPGGGMVTISSIPEPSTLVLGVIASLGGLLVYRRNRRRSA